MATETVKELPPDPDFRAVIKLWGSRSALAGDLGVEHWLVEAWWRKNSIPPRWFDPVTRAAIKRDFTGVSNDVLLALHVKRVEEGPSEPPRSKKNGRSNESAVAAGADA